MPNADYANKYPQQEDSQGAPRSNSILRGRALPPVGCAAFKAVEVRLRAWWVRLLPLPPFSVAENIFSQQGPVKSSLKTPNRFCLDRLVARALLEKHYHQTRSSLLESRSPLVINDFVSPASVKCPAITLMASPRAVLLNSQVLKAS